MGYDLYAISVLFVIDLLVIFFMKKKVKNAIPVLEYDHIYLVNGFALSKAITEKKKEYKPKRRHACIESGYLCEKQLSEERITKNNFMYIWHEDIIEKLCPEHLSELYELIWKTFDELDDNRIRNDLKLEFNEFRIELAYRQYRTYCVARSKGIQFDSKPLSPHDIHEEPLFQLMRELRHYKPFKSKAEQLRLVGERGCCGL
jgi:hypothetical protein